MPDCQCFSSTPKISSLIGEFFPLPFFQLCLESRFSITMSRLSLCYVRCQSLFHYIAHSKVWTKKRRKKERRRQRPRFSFLSFSLFQAAFACLLPSSRNSQSEAEPRWERTSLVGGFFCSSFTTKLKRRGRRRKRPARKTASFALISTKVENSLHEYINSLSKKPKKKKIATFA